jgi:AraC-like DNA-binding protein
VAQNSHISSQKEKFPKFRRNEGGDSDDFERYKLMDQAVTEQKLFLNADINRNQLMRLAGVDKNRLAQMMRKYANTNFAGYINSKRMDYAVQLIKEHPEYTMKTIAETCGFSSQSTFFRVFKSVYGITPTDFSHTGSLPRKEADLPFEEELSESQNGQNDHKNGRIISFYTASDKA